MAIGALDEPAHLATTGLLLLGFFACTGRRVPFGLAAVALIASVAIDIDHIPQFLGWHGLTEGTPRPYTHSLMTLAFVLVAVAVTRRSTRTLTLGIAIGIASHLFRDLATGPGVPLLWPASTATVRLSYLVYVAIMAGVAAAALAGSQRSTASVVPAGVGQRAV